MTVTEDTLEESTTTDPLDEVISALETAVTGLQNAAGAPPSPAALRDRASKVRAFIHLLMTLPLRMHEDAARCDAQAAALRDAKTAQDAVAQTASNLRDAEEAYETTAGPVSTASADLVTAGQRAQEAADRVEQADRDGIGGEPLEALIGRRRDADEAFDRVRTRQAGAQQARPDAGEDRDQARAAHRKALEGLAAAEAAAGNPSPASLSTMDLYEALMFSFPFVLFGEEKPTPEQLAMCRYHATTICDDFGWTPAGAEARIGSRSPAK